MKTKDSESGYWSIVKNFHSSLIPSFGRMRISAKIIMQNMNLDTKNSLEYTIYSELKLFTTLLNLIFSLSPFVNWLPLISWRWPIVSLQRCSLAPSIAHLKSGFILNKQQLEPNQWESLFLNLALRSSSQSWRRLGCETL